MEYEIRPLSLGEILDQGVQVFVNHFRTLFLIALALMIPFTFFMGALGWILMPYSSFWELLFRKETTPELRLVESLRLALWFLLVLPLTHAAVIRAVAQEYLGHRAAPAECLRAAFGFVLPLIWIGILILLGLWGASFPFAFAAGIGFMFPPALILAALLAILPVFVYSRWWFAFSVAVIENRRGLRAIQRSWDLVRGRTFTALILWAMLTFLVAASMILTVFVKPVLLGLAVQSIVMAVIMLLGASIRVVFYFSSRARLEGFNQAALAESVAEVEPDQSRW